MYLSVPHINVKNSFFNGVNLCSYDKNETVEKDEQRNIKSLFNFW